MLIVVHSLLLDCSLKKWIKNIIIPSASWILYIWATHTSGHYVNIYTCKSGWLSCPVIFFFTSKQPLRQITVQFYTSRRTCVNHKLCRLKSEEYIYSNQCVNHCIRPTLRGTALFFKCTKLPRWRRVASALQWMRNFFKRKKPWHYITQFVSAIVQ